MLVLRPRLISAKGERNVAAAATSGAYQNYSTKMSVRGETQASKRSERVLNYLRNSPSQAKIVEPINIVLIKS